MFHLDDDLLRSESVWGNDLSSLVQIGFASNLVCKQVGLSQVRIKCGIRYWIDSERVRRRFSTLR